MMFGDLSNIGLSMIRKITDLWAGAKSDSLIDYTQVARVEPIVLIDTDCLYYQGLMEIQQSLLSIFAGYYLQAVAISTTVGKIEVVRHLDRLNPKRNPVDSAADAAGYGAHWLLAQESYRDALPIYGKQIAMEAPGDRADNALKEQLLIAKVIQDENKFDAQQTESARKAEHERLMLEAKNAEFDLSTRQYYAKQAMDQKTFDQNVKEVQRNYELNVKKMGEDKALREAQLELQKKGLALQEKQREDSLSASEIGFGRDTIKTLQEVSNLSVGKLFTVEITDGLHKASIPIAIRLLASSLPTDSLVHILSRDSQDKSMKERYHAWKAGRLAFIKDLCLCQDLIKAHRKNLMADSDNLYTSLIKRNRGNQISTIVSGNPSVATASNMVIMSSETAGQIEVALNGKLKDFKTREKMLDETYLMIVAVVDKSWDRVTLYHRGLPHPTEVSLRDIKASNKSGVDVGDVLSAYRVGQSPTI